MTDKSYYCIHCDYDGEFVEKRSYEFADADGNRGVWLDYLECPECGRELI